MIIARLEGLSLGMAAQSAHAATRGWFMTTTDVVPYADALVTVANGQIVGAFRVVAHQRTGIGRTHFQIETSPRLAFLIGQPSPFEVSAAPDFAVCVSTELVLRHSHVRHQARWREAMGPATTASRRPRLSHERPRAAGTRTNCTD